MVNGYDRTIIGNPEIPEIIYGFGGTLKYKKWDLSLFFQGVAKVSLMMSDIHPFSEAGHKGYNIAQYIVDDHWSESNNVAGAAYPRLSPEFITNNAKPALITYVTSFPAPEECRTGLFLLPVAACVCSRY